MTEQEYQERMERKRLRIEAQKKKKRQSQIILCVTAVLLVVAVVAIVVIHGQNKKAKSQTAEASSIAAEASEAENAANQEASKDSREGEDPDLSESSEEQSVAPGDVLPPSEESSEESPEEEASEEESSEPEPVTLHANVAVIGDLMVHREQLEKAYNWETGTFSFEPSYAMIRDELSAPNYTVGNLETTFGGEDTWTADRFQGYTGYPCFNSPDILATNLKDAGIDFVGTANNHSMDSGRDGIQRTLEVVRAAGLDSTGTFSELDAPRYIVEDIGGIRIAFMAYTYGANGFAMPVEEEGYFNSFVDYDQDKIDKMYEDVKEAAAQEDVDLVAVLLHMGEEYQYTPTWKTQEVVDELFASGCDIVYASHPHVLEPFEIRELDNGDGTTRPGFVIYSLGNFISAQHYTSDRPYFMDVGVILDMDFEKTDDEPVQITGIRLMPTYCQWTDTTIRVIPVEKAIYSCENGDNYYNCTDYHYQRLLASREFFQTTVWPEEYPYTIDNGYYEIDLDKIGQTEESEENTEENTEEAVEE